MYLDSSLDSCDHLDVRVPPSARSRACSLLLNWAVSCATPLPSVPPSCEDDHFHHLQLPRAILGKMAATKIYESDALRATETNGALCSNMHRVNVLLYTLRSDSKIIDRALRNHSFAVIVLGKKDFLLG